MGQRPGADESLDLDASGWLAGETFGFPWQLDACRQVRRASTYSPPSLTRPSGRRCGEGVCGKVPGLGRSLAGCFGGLRTVEVA